MKSAAVTTFFALLAVFGHHASAQEDRTITKIVKLLQSMLEKSKADADADRVLFAKFQCYCDTKKESKTKEIESLTKDMGILSSDIQDLLGSTSQLSVEVAGLKKALATNAQARAEAEEIRAKEHESFEATETDLKNAMGQMDGALNTLAEVGADQTLAAAAEKAKFMAKPALLNLRSTVQKALFAASSFLDEKPRQKVEAFIQAPFTGSYSSQSGEVVGILKNMRDTFESNLAAAQSTEKAQAAGHAQLIKIKEAESAQMQKLYEEKQDQLGGNDDQLADKRKQLEDAQAQKAIREQFLAQLMPVCEQKAAEYKERAALRSNEDAAITEAVSILNSDAAFATFGSVAATSTGATGADSFLQRAAVRVHSPVAQTRQQVLRILRAAASSVKTFRMTKVLALVEAENPFAVIVGEIEKVIKVLDEEGKVDKRKLDWCNSEREASDSTIEEKKATIVALNDDITTLTNDIDGPETGLKAQIAATDLALQENAENQRVSTNQRNAEHAAFEKNVKDLTSAEKLLGRAMNVLRKYYESLGAHAKEASEAAVLAGEDEAHPETWEAEGGYKGQSSEGGKALEMLEFILQETKKEAATAQKDEANSQGEFEEFIAEQKTAESTLQSSLATLKKALAEKERDLLQKTESHKNTEKEQAAVEAYLADIKPGCDFITANFESRESSRATERTSLLSVQDLITGSPVYKAAVAAADMEALGPCKDKCVDEPKHAECKACLAGVTVPGYCAGHPDTPGC